MICANAAVNTIDNSPISWPSWLNIISSYPLFNPTVTLLMLCYRGHGYAGLVPCGTLVPPGLEGPIQMDGHSTSPHVGLLVL